MRLKRTYVQVLCRLMPKMIKAANFDAPDLVQKGTAISWAREFILSKYSRIVQSRAATLAKLGLSVICLVLIVNCPQYYATRCKATVCSDTGCGLTALFTGCYPIHAWIYV